MKKVLLWGLGICVLIAGGVSTLASSHPDGLEHVAETLGFGSAATPHASSDSPLADYAVRGLGSGTLSGAIAGLVGITVVALFAFGLMRLLKPSPKR